MGFAGQWEHVGSMPGPKSTLEKHRGMPGPGAGACRATRLLAGAAGRQRGEGWSWMLVLGREGGMEGWMMDGLHVWGVTASIPKERREGLG